MNTGLEPPAFRQGEIQSSVLEHFEEMATNGMRRLRDDLRMHFTLQIALALLGNVGGAI